MVHPPLALAAAALAAALVKPAATPPAPPAPPPDVRLTVAEESPSRWRMRVENAGAVPVRVMADARLLSFEVTPAGAKKALRCVLPGDMRPEVADERALVVPPQRAYVESFDPRVYCFGAAEAAALAPGAAVVAHLGWASPPKGRKAAGPFEVEPLEGVTPAVAPAKEIVSAPWTVAAVAGVSAEPPSLAASTDDGAASLVVSSQEHADATHANEVAVAVTVANHGTKPTTFLFRTETLAFDVIGPDGTLSRCGGTRAVDSPIRELYDTIAPKGHRAISVLLSQLCPRHTLDLAGVYEVTSILDTRRASGRSVGLVTFDGVATATKATRLRLRRTRWSSQSSRPALD